MLQPLPTMQEVPHSVLPNNYKVSFCLLGLLFFLSQLTVDVFYLFRLTEVRFHRVAQADFRPHSPASASNVLGLQACTNLPSLPMPFSKFYLVSALREFQSGQSILLQFCSMRQK